MPTYEYEYTRNDGKEIRVTRYNVSVSKCSEPIEVVDESDGNTYIAERVISLTADMSHSWSDDVRNSDLPPVHYTPEDVKADLAKRKGRKLKKHD